MKKHSKIFTKLDKQEVPVDDVILDKLNQDTFIEVMLRNHIKSIFLESNKIDKQASPETVIYCDMDGVLVDFASGTIELLNSILSNDNSKHLQHKKVRKTRDKVKQSLGDEWRAKEGSDLDLPAVRNFMFAVISLSPGKFFASLHPLEDGSRDLWSFINNSGYEVALLTAGIPGKEDRMSAEDGKKQWAKAHLNPHPKEVIVSMSKLKPDYAMGKNGTINILIDDKKSTVDVWNQRGGIGILHIPGESSRTISQLKKIL